MKELQAVYENVWKKDVYHNESSLAPFYKPLRRNAQSRKFYFVPPLKIRMMCWNIVGGGEIWWECVTMCYIWMNIIMYGADQLLGSDCLDM